MLSIGDLQKLIMRIRAIRMGQAMIMARRNVVVAKGIHMLSIGDGGILIRMATIRMGRAMSMDKMDGRSKDQ